MGDPNTATRDRLLDAAEELVANQGYNSTSLRQITRQAGANVAAVNYHFGSKEGLVAAVIERRITPLDKIRHARLDEIVQGAEANGRRPDVGMLLRAFIEPTLTYLVQEPGARHFIRIIGRAHTEPEGVVKRVFLTAIRPILMRLFENLCTALPDVPRQTVFFRLLFSIGAMSNAATMMTDEKFNAQFQLGLDASAGIDHLVAELLAYVTRGMETPCVCQSSQ